METTQQHSKRRRKVSDGKQNEVSIDRISDLPDSVICHILSFLSTKLSVRTSILARRWRYLWAYVPNLDFDCNNHHDIIDKVMLMHRMRSINTFRLFSEENYIDFIDDRVYQTETWISIAIDRNVRNIDLCFSNFMTLPNRLFTCKTLVDLRLDHSGAIPDVGIVVYLPHLKKLHLIYVNYEGDESLSHLISGCPVLEELVIQLYVDSQSCKISSPTIKRLMIELQCEGDDSDDQDYYRLEINTPALVYLQLADSSAHHIKTEPLTSLIEADIYIHNYIESDDYFNHFLYFRYVALFINALHNVKCLKLDLSQIANAQIIDSVFSACMTTRFHNLIKLELTGHCWFLSKFLENADNLKILFLWEFFEGIGSWMEPQQVPKCLLSHLRTIRLCEDIIIEHQFKIVRYLLRNAKFLERMEIPYRGVADSMQQIIMFHKISKFERRSRACEIALIS